MDGTQVSFTAFKANDEHSATPDLDGMGVFTRQRVVRTWVVEYDADKVPGHGHDHNDAGLEQSIGGHRIRQVEAQLRAHVDELKAKLQAQAHELEASKQEKLEAQAETAQTVNLQTQVHELGAKLAAANEETADLQRNLRAAQDETAQVKTESDARRDIQVHELEAKLKATNEDTAQAKADNAQLGHELSAKLEATNVLQTQVHELSARLKATIAETAHLQTQVDQLSANLEASNQETTRLQTQLRAARHSAAREAAERRRWLGVVLATRGYLSVMCRMRPRLLPREKDEPLLAWQLEVVKGNNTNGVELVVQRPRVGTTSTEQPCLRFRHDRFLGPDDIDDTVWDEVSLLVRAAMDAGGQKRQTFIAYGPTGAGKTHTMGFILGRTALCIFPPDDDEKKHLRVSVSAVELYRDKLYDLLVDFPGHDDKPNTNEKKKPTARTPLDPPKGSSPFGLPSARVSCPAESAAQLDLIFGFAAAARSQRKTVANTGSSRSHCITTVEMTAFHEEGRDTGSSSYLTFVDLAGSERRHNSSEDQQQVDRKELEAEADSINRGLSALKTVLGQQVANNNKDNGHVSYRDNALTKLLQPVLALGSGSGRVLVMLAVSPLAKSAGQTVQALQFGDEASRITTTKTANREK